MYITIDSGTTNTRVALVRDKNIIQKIKINAGARDTAVTGSTDKLKNELKNAFDRIFSENGLKEADIKGVIASGMIVSDAGLHPISHVTAPASAKKLADASETVAIPEITNLPITFIPGVKNNCDYSNTSYLKNMDIMRGEETETFGILSLNSVKAPFVAVLPGSHTKTVTVSENGDILSCRTTLCGEMIKAISENTILKDAFGDELPNDFSEEYLTLGYDFSHEYGLNSALFKVRLLKMFFKASNVQAYSFFIGAILEADIKMIKEDLKSSDTSIVIGGSNPLREIFSVLIKKYTDVNPTVLDDKTVDKCTFIGGIHITESLL